MNLPDGVVNQFCSYNPHCTAAILQNDATCNFTTINEALLTLIIFGGRLLKFQISRNTMHWTWNSLAPASAAQTSQASRHSGAASPKCLESCFRRQLRLWPRLRMFEMLIIWRTRDFMQYFVDLSLSPAPACISLIKLMMDWTTVFFVGGWEVRGKSILDWCLA